MDVKPARIVIVEEKARKPLGNLEPYYDVQFNPTEYTRTKSAQIAEIGIYGLDSPILQFIRGQNEKLNLDLFFDSTTLGRGMGDNAISVTTLTKPFYELVKIQPHTHAPPKIQFVWSDDLQFDAIVESITQKFTLFNPQGVPLRATLTMSFREFRNLDLQISYLKPESSDHTKRRLTKRGDTLSRIAAEEYGDPAMWRWIADYNPRVNPRRLMPGTLLLIPPVEASRLLPLENR